MTSGAQRTAECVIVVVDSGQPLACHKTPGRSPAERVPLHFCAIYRRRRNVGRILVLSLKALRPGKRGSTATADLRLFCKKWPV